MDDHSASEPVFRGNKRRKVYRRRTSSGGAEEEGVATLPASDIGDAGRDPVNEENTGTGVVRLQKKPGAKKHGIGFTSNEAARNTEEAESEQRALVLASENGTAETIQSDRFVRPTGRVAVAENKHMAAYIDSKMAEMRSATSTPNDGASSNREDAEHPPEPSEVKERQQTATSTVPATDLPSERSYDRAQSRSTRAYQRPTKRRQPPPRAQTDIARDSIIDQIMQESQVPLYERSNSNTPANDTDNDAATAAAFKAQLIAEMEERNRKRPPPANPATKGTTTSHGPKLGGSRSQRARMMEEKMNAAKK